MRQFVCNLITGSWIEKGDIVNLLIIDEKKELIPRQSFRIRGATQLESDLFTANDYALITR